MAETLAKLGIATVQDALFHLPMRYLNRTRITPMRELALNSSVVVEGHVKSCSVVFGRRRSLFVTLEDASGTVNLRFFHFNAAQKAMFAAGNRIRCAGDPRLGSTGLEFYHPEYEVIDDNNIARKQKLEEALTPIYSLTDGITQPRLRSIAEASVALLKQYAPQELLPSNINQQFSVGSLSEALRYVHFPPKDADIQALMEGLHPYQQRLAFEELLAHYLTRLRTREIAQREQAPRFPETGAYLEDFLAALPFSPTNAQQKVFTDIQADMSKASPMLRMVQGDVGSGKTVVAAMASLLAITHGYQVAVVAPTEILAEQHLKSFTGWLEPLGIKVVWLVGKLGAAKKREALAAISDGSAKLVVGTHALFQEHVSFARLGLSIIDEQHRFGVNQRLSLRQKSQESLMPHQLVMTATPIPRTLAMTAYAELDYSVIDELPPGRTPINTALLGQGKRDQIIERIAIACAEKKQVYWVCPLVEESETLSAANAEETFAHLTESLGAAKVGLVHGRLKASEKESVMNAFKAGDIDLLVATTVIEVGVDVPNASLMIIENPERLGLAQLHQLRGRVGRGKIASHCLLLYGENLSEHARERLSILRETNDGFLIAEKDLELRGPGELLGTRQTGDMLYRLADLQRDAHLIPQVHELGNHMAKHRVQEASELVERWFGHRQAYVNA